MENVGTLDDLVVRFHDYMTRTAAKASRQMKAHMDADDLYQDFFMILRDLHVNPKYNNLPIIEFTKAFYTSINNAICNLVTQKRSRNRVKNVSIDTSKKDTKNKSHSMKDTLERSEMNDESYKVGLMDILTHVSPETATVVLDAFNPNTDTSLGHKKAFEEVSKYLRG